MEIKTNGMILDCRDVGLQISSGFISFWIFQIQLKFYAMIFFKTLYS